MTRDLYTYQILIILISVLLILRSFFQLLRKKKDFQEFFLSLIIWGAFATLSLFPNLISFVSHLLGFELGSNAIFTFSIIILFFITLQLLVKTDRLESSITKLVRELALEKVKKEK